MNMQEEYTRVPCQTVLVGPGPDEVVVKIYTADQGWEEVIVSKNSVTDRGLAVAQVGLDQRKALIELPRESVSGKWRLWVEASEVLR